jgi:hypothetical protein
MYWENQIRRNRNPVKTCMCFECYDLKGGKSRKIGFACKLLVSKDLVRYGFVL